VYGLQTSLTNNSTFWINSRTGGQKATGKGGSGREGGKWKLLRGNEGGANATAAICERELERGSLPDGKAKLYIEKSKDIRLSRGTAKKPHD